MTSESMIKCEERIGTQRAAVSLFTHSHTDTHTHTHIHTRTHILTYTHTHTHTIDEKKL